MMICRFATMTGTPSRVVCWTGRAGASAADAAPANSRKARIRALNTRNLRETSDPNEYRAHLGGIDRELVALQVELVVHEVVAAVHDQRVADHPVVLRFSGHAAILVRG